MAPEKVTKMVLHVDLNCSNCYNKVKKILSKIPEIRDQEYDVEKNKVMISVVSCCPDKIREKLCHKGGTSIQKILVLLPDKPKQKPSPPSPAAGDHKPKPKEEPVKEKPPKEAAAPKKQADPSPKPEVAKMIIEPPVQGYPHMYPVAATYHPMVYDQGYIQSFQAPTISYGYGYEHGYNHNGYNANAQTYTNSDYYFSEENPQGCSIM